MAEFKPGDWVFTARRKGNQKPYLAGQVVEVEQDGKVLVLKIRHHNKPLAVRADQCRPWKARMASAA